MGQIPVPAMALSQRVLMDFTKNEEIHSNGLDHSLPALSMATAEAPGLPLQGVMSLGSTSWNSLWYFTSATTESIDAVSKSL
jgi:hypothetical protein